MARDTNRQLKQLRRAADEAVQGMGVPTCKTCAHRSGRGYFARCGATGWYTSIARRLSDECGQQGRLWTPNPPTFWQRLGSAIFERIQLRHTAMTPDQKEVK